MRDRQLLFGLATDLASVMKRPAFIIIRQDGEGYATTIPLHEKNLNIQLLATVLPGMNMVPCKETRS